MPMNNEIIVAIIAAIGVVVAAVVTGIFSLIKKDASTSSTYNIKQSQKGKDNTQIGIQNNYKNNNEKENE